MNVLVMLSFLAAAYNFSQFMLSQKEEKKKLVFAIAFSALALFFILSVEMPGQ